MQLGSKLIYGSGNCRFTSPTNSSTTSQRKLAKFIVLCDYHPIEWASHLIRELYKCCYSTFRDLASLLIVVAHRCHSWIWLLNDLDIDWTIDWLTSCIEPFHTRKDSIPGQEFGYYHFSNSKSYKVCGVFSSRDLSSWVLNLVETEAEL